MDLITTQLSPGDYFLLRKSKISEEIKLLKDFVQQYKSIPEMKNKIIDYFQSLREDLQNIESLMQHGEPLVSSNLNGTNLHHGQEITQIREQNTYFEPTLNKESEMVMNTSMESSSSIKRRKLKSKVWEDFIKYVGKEEKEWAKCKHCEKEFVGSSKSGTTHLKNHLKSCQGLRTPGGVANKGKMKSVIGPNLNGSELVSRIIKYGLNDIKDDILIIYEQKKCNFRGYLDKLPSRFSVSIELWDEFRCLRIWFVDDSWELRNMIIYFNNGYDVYEIMKPVLVDWNIHRKISSVIYSKSDPIINEKHVENLKNWFKERGSISFIMASFWPTFYKIRSNLSFYELKKISPDKILTKASNLQSYASRSLNDYNFNHAVAKALSKGKLVTSQSVPWTSYQDESLFEWVMGCKEVFCELEHIDPHFKPINFTREDWDDATLMYGCWQVMKDFEKEIDSLSNASKTVNVYFSVVCHFFLRFDQLRKSDNSYLRTIASRCLGNVFEWWVDPGLVIDVSVILDPRLKIETLESYYKMIYGNDAETHFHKIIDDVKIFFSNCVKGTSSSCSSHDYNTTLESELECYLKEEHPEDKGIDILQWWRDKSPIYPSLARIARDLLSIPFKTPHLDYPLQGEIENILYGSSLDDDLKCKLACTKIWLNTSENN